jgi:hypothetical protein
MTGEGITLGGETFIENFTWNICRCRPRRRWEDGIKKEIREEGVDRIHMTRTYCIFL